MSCKFLLILLSAIIMDANAQDSIAPGHVSAIILKAPQLHSGERTIWIYLPADYDMVTTRYPVVYMHDGQNLFDKNTSAYGEWHVDEQLDSLKARAIVVGIGHGGDRRIDELTPYTHEKYGGGQADAYLDFVVNTVKPYVDGHYRTKKKPGHTAIFGSSVGGLVSFYAVIKYPRVFGSAGIFSPSFWFSEDIYDLVHQTEKIDARLYFMAGDHESENMVRDLDRMLELLQPKMDKKRLHKKIVHNGRHDETLWGQEFSEAYLWLSE